MEKKDREKYGLSELESRFGELPPEYLQAQPGYPQIAEAVEKRLRQILGAPSEEKPSQ